MVPVDFGASNKNKICTEENVSDRCINMLIYMLEYTYVLCKYTIYIHVWYDCNCTTLLYYLIMLSHMRIVYVFRYMLHEDNPTAITVA